VPDLVPHVLPAGALNHLPQPVLPAGGLCLRPWEAGDAPALVAAYGDPEVQHWNGFALEGTRVRSVLHDDGWHDMHLHARLADG